MYLVRQELRKYAHFLTDRFHLLNYEELAVLLLDGLESSVSNRLLNCKTTLGQLVGSTAEELLSIRSGSLYFDVAW